MLRAYLNYGLIASVVIWAAIVGMMAYRLNESPWRWAFVGLVFAGGLTIAVILWIKKYVDRMNEAEKNRRVSCESENSCHVETGHSRSTR